jgi:hypothetical protein
MTDRHIIAGHCVTGFLQGTGRELAAMGVTSGFAGN